MKFLFLIALGYIAYRLFFNPPAITAPGKKQQQQQQQPDDGEFIDYEEVD